MFKRFDKNGDGVFSYLEFECAFTVLDIEFSKEELRKLINMTDSNKDGRIDMKEFHTMLYSTELEDMENEEQIIEEVSDDDDSDFEEQKTAVRRVGAGGRATTEIPMSEKLRKLQNKAPSMVAQQDRIEEDIQESLPNEPIMEEEIEESMPMGDSL